MNDSEKLLQVVTDASNLVRKQGFTTGGVSWTLNNANNTITATVIIPITFDADDTTGELKVVARDFLEAPTP